MNPLEPLASCTQALILATEKTTSNSPSFVPSLITGLVTGLIALGGVIYTQRRAAHREDERWGREEARLANERDWQRELWARDHRREAHLAFLAEQRRLDHWMMMYTRVGLEGVETPKEDWTEPLGRLFLAVQVFGSQEAAIAAQRLYKATTALRSGTVGDMMRADHAIEVYRKLVQKRPGSRCDQSPGLGIGGKFRIKKNWT